MFGEVILMVMGEADETVYLRFLDTSSNDDLRTLFERYRDPLTLFIFGFLHNMEDAEELILDAFAVIASGTNVFSGKSSFKTWLFAIGRNLAYKKLRRNHFFFVPLEEELTADSGRPDEELLKDERSKMLYEALGTINPEYIQALHLTYFEGMSADEVADVLKKNRKQVYNLISRGKESLRSKLIEMGFEE